MPADAPFQPPLFAPVGDNPALAFGMGTAERACALARKAGMACADKPAPGRPAMLADMDFAWDPVWLKTMVQHPGSVLMLGDRAVLAHLPPGFDAAPVIAAMESKSPWRGEGLERLDAETFEVTYAELRKRDRPFVMRLDAASAESVERAAYDASYKGVTDALTLYLWRRAAFHLTRWAALAGMSPNQVTLVGALLCAATFFLWLNAYWWSGVATAFGFMVLDTVDGKLARCTGQSSKWGNIFDHGLDLVHPPFWWWAWAEGLELIGDPFERVYEILVVAAIIFGYIAQRFIEGVFMRRFGMHIHVWRPIDSKFRLITARRNPNMVILVASLMFLRPDVGLEYVALWTLLSLIFHAVRLSQANDRLRRGLPVTGWLS